MNNIQGDRQYLKYWRSYLDKPEREYFSICSAKIPGKYCIEFKNFKAIDFFNSLETSKKLMNSDYYPPSIIVKKERDWDILELEEEEFYNCYPKYYGSSENSICIGKKFIKNSKPSYPFLIQDKIQSKSENNDESIFILYVKKDNNISAYYAPTKIENTNSLLCCLINIQQFIIPEFDSKNYSEIEYLITEFDVIEDNHDKFWVKGINWDPNFDSNSKLNNLDKIVNDIFQHIQTLKFNYFLDLSLEKFVQTHCSSSSL
jgi:hypothetical protein